MVGPPSRVVDIFLACEEAVRRGVLIRRANRQDKEFHFQEWFRTQLGHLAIPYDAPARNTYPDFRLVESTEGYELKGLAYPGREANYDSNSQVPTGFHNGRTIYYLFGRYPKDPDGDEYPVIDLVMCHGSFLNADREYTHENKNIKGFGSYGDIMIRDRKMYVSPTPFALIEGAAAQRTLVLPRDAQPDARLEPAGTLLRVEATNLVIGYEFDLRSNVLTPKRIANSRAGTRHGFIAYRRRGSPGPPVAMKAASATQESGA